MRNPKYSNGKFSVVNHPLRDDWKGVQRIHVNYRLQWLHVYRIGVGVNLEYGLAGSTR
jgi:mRNA-degrading endonuclease YafQ of YafQ-DinJ toxin-antitoxin module